MVEFQAPHWFFLLVPLALGAYFWRSWQLWRPLRATALVLLVLLLADPHASRLRRGLDLWVLIDRSASARPVTESSWPEWRQLLERARPGPDHRLRILNFAAEAVEATSAETSTYAGEREQSRLLLAVETALASLDPRRPSRLLVFSDGYATEPLDQLGNKLIQAGVELDYRLARPPETEDFRIRSLTLPARRQPGEPFLLEVTMEGTSDGPREVLLSRNGQSPRKFTVRLENGVGRLRLASRLSEPGAHHFLAELADPDAYLGNNRFEAWIDIAAGSRVVLISPWPDDPLPAILTRHGFRVENVSEPASLHPGILSGCEVLILNNMPAYDLPPEFLAALDFFIRHQGGGLLMTGGRQSFGAGGYFDSPVDPLLPVSMELKAEHRKLVVALSIVMDRSGSMSAQVPGGQTKMELANEGAGRAVELLGDFDQVTVHAVDSRAVEQVPLLPVGPNRGRISDLIRRIGSGGGGIYVYEGLRAAWDNLKDAPVGQRHIILFSDAADSEQPGAYQDLLREIVANKGSVSVIGLGKDTDADASLLEDIAKRGQGRIFFTEDATTLPNVFAQETVTVARSLFLDEPTEVAPTGRWIEVSPAPIEWLPSVDGYNLSYARPEATVALVSADEYEAPLLAFVQRGLGRSAALSFPVGGEFAAATRSWPEAGDVLQTLVRWLSGESLPPGIGIRTDLDGTRLQIDLFHDESDALLEAAPRILLHERAGASANDAIREIPWERMAPGQFRATTQLEPARQIRGAIQIGSSAIPFGPIAVGSNPEWSFDPRRVEELKQAAARSGGEERVNLANAWEHPPRRQAASLRNLLLPILLVVILLDALLTRMGWRLPGLALSRPWKTARQPGPGPSPPRTGEPARAVPAEEPGTEAEKPEGKPDRSPDERRARFERAKRRR